MLEHTCTPDRDNGGRNLDGCEACSREAFPAWMSSPRTDAERRATARLLAEVDAQIRQERSNA
jgi:hypothetical protein